MDDQTIKQIVDEIAPLLVGRLPGKLFQLTAQSLAIDFRLRESSYLFISVEPAQPRLHLIERRVRDLEKASMPPSPFALLCKKELSGLALQSIGKDPGDRIVRCSFSGRDDLGQPRTRLLVAQLTGRAANLLLLDHDNVVLGSLRAARGSSIGETYQPPARSSNRPVSEAARSPVGSPAGLAGLEQYSSLSARLDAHYRTLALEQDFNSRAANAQAQLLKALTRTDKLLQKLQDDLASHADAEQQKRLGDLLLANLSTAKRQGSRVKLIDYFEEGAPVIELDVDENSTLQEEAARRFAAYSRAKRATVKIRERIAGVTTELGELKTRRDRLAKILTARDEAALAAFSAVRSAPPATGGRSKGKPGKKVPGTRRYLSSDDLEILVGRAAHDNDHLTFKVARPNDLWLHAADYPGSHVVVRNSTRKEIPPRTIIEAAQLAAYFSDARKDSKVTVHYTLRKFLSKPKGAAPGLVRLTRSKSITVAPSESGERV